MNINGKTFTVASPSHYTLTKLGQTFNLNPTSADPKWAQIRSKCYQNLTDPSGTLRFTARETTRSYSSTLLYFSSTLLYLNLKVP